MMDAQKGITDLQLFTVQTVAGLLSVSQDSIYRLVAEGILHGLKVRGSKRITAESVRAYIKKQQQQFELDNGIFSE